MSTKVLICDDSKIARKQLAKVLPNDWSVEIEFAENGQDALEQIAANAFDVLFLDLNMPVKDGYETAEDIRTLLLALKLFSPNAQASETPNDVVTAAESFTLQETLQEVSNIAMGRAASVLAEMLNVFIKLPVPRVNILEVGELQMALEYSVKEDSCSAVSQGFVGSGIAFEALLIFNDSSFPDMATLLGMTDAISREHETELLMDVSSVLVGPFMAAVGKQLNIDFSHGHPTLLGQHVRIADLINVKKASWKRTLAVEIVYEVENYQINCDLMLLFTEDSVPTLEHLLSFLAEDE